MIKFHDFPLPLLSSGSIAGPKIPPKHEVDRDEVTLDSLLYRFASRATPWGKLELNPDVHFLISEDGELSGETRKKKKKKKNEHKSLDSLDHMILSSLLFEHCFLPTQKHIFSTVLVQPHCGEPTWWTGRVSGSVRYRTGRDESFTVRRAIWGSR